MLDKLFRLDGKVALVTGGSRGLGKEMALVLSHAGAAVAVTARTRESAQAAASEIAAATGGQTLALAAEASDEAQVRAAVEGTLEALGGLDILVNNAGVNKRKPIESFLEEEWDWVQDVNLKGPYLFMKYAAPHMREKKWGRIINMASMMAHIALPERGAYCSSKAGLLGLTRAVALELAPHGVTVNALSPGPCGTEMNQAIMQNPEAYEFFRSRLPMGRWARPEEMQGPLLFLASEASSFMTGQSLVVDGGWTVQ